MNNPQLIPSLYQIGAIQFGKFTLKNGALSDIYLDLRKIISYPSILRTIANLLWQQIQPCHFDLICGVPYTALPIATCLSLQYNIPMVMRRKEKKNYGTKQTIEGRFTPGQTCLVIEDVVTTGSSIIETVHDLKEAGLQVKDISAVISREQGGEKNLKDNHLSLYTAISLNEILNTLIHSTDLPETERTLAAHLLTQSYM